VLYRRGMGSLRIAAAAPDDWVRVRAVRLAALADSPDAFGSSLAREAPQPEEWWRARLAAADRVTLLAVIGEADVGMVAGGPHHDLGGDAGLYGMWVSSGHRGAGVATALIRRVIVWAGQAGHRRLLLDVADRNEAAIACYLRNGFRPTGRRSTLPPPRHHIAEHELGIELGLDLDHSDEADAGSSLG
jgi:RimJ/RimL family protein N-acetyltransferase